MGAWTTALNWPVLRQAVGAGPVGPWAPPRSPRTAVSCDPARRPPTGSSRASARTARSAAGRTSTSRTSKVVQIEGDPDSPISRGRLCPKGSASKQLVTGPTAGHDGASTAARTAREWEDLDLDTAMDMIADRVLDDPRARAGSDEDDGKRVRRTMGIASLGGATLDNEENYLMKKLYTALGAIQIENQARI